MEITIDIDNKPVRFKSTGGIIYRYEAQFGRSLFADLTKLQEFEDSKRLKKKKNPDGKIVFEPEYDYTKLSFNLMYDLCWVCAKAADDSIPDPQSWLDSFNVFPIQDIIPKISELINKTAGINPKN